MAGLKYHIKGIGKNKEIRKERMKPIPLMKIDISKEALNEIDGNRSYRRGSREDKVPSEVI